MEQTRCVKVRLPQKEKRQDVYPAVRWRIWQCVDQRPPCVKGAVTEGDWRIVGYRTTPPSRLTPCHLPLHRGGFGRYPRPVAYVPSTHFTNSSRQNPGKPRIATVRALNRFNPKLSPV